MELLNCDMIVYCGVIMEYGSIKHFGVESSDVELANEEEIAFYKFIQKT